MLNNYHSIPTFEDTSFSIFLDGKIKAQRGTSHTTQGKIIKSFEILKTKSKQKFLNFMIAPSNTFMHNKKCWQILLGHPFFSWRECFVAMTRS